MFRPTHPIRTIMINLLIALSAGMSALVMIEIVSFFVVCFVWIPGDPPSYDYRDLGDPLAGTPVRDNNQDFGTWHRPRWNFVHRKSGRRVEYFFNSFGARDKERSIQAEKCRAVMLGDSFIEGWLLESKDRLSNLLERWSGFEVLNFGTSGYFGTVQYWLLYKYLASTFDHDFVLVGVLPYNDFEDNDFQQGQRIHRHRYRPYLVGAYPSFDIIYADREYFFVEGKSYPWNHVAKSFVLNFSMIYRKVLHHLPRFQVADGGGLPYSGFYDFSDADWKKMRYSLEQLCELARKREKRVIVFTIPVWTDVVRYRQAGEAPLARNMRELSETIGFTCVDMLPEFARKCEVEYKGVEPPPCWITDDGHWTTRGNLVAFEILKPALVRMGFGERSCGEKNK